MRRTRKYRFSTRQRLSALVCFVALMLMYAQIASAAVMVISGTCCSGDQCPIHGSHHHPQKTDYPPMDCGHGEHNMSTMDNCSMSCCHDTDLPAVHGNLFLLPAFALHLTRIIFCHPVCGRDHQDFFSPRTSRSSSQIIPQLIQPVFFDFVGAAF